MKKHAGKRRMLKMGWIDELRYTGGQIAIRAQIAGDNGNAAHTTRRHRAEQVSVLSLHTRTMLKNLSRLSVPQRRFVFFAVVIGVVLLFIGFAALLISSALNSGGRVVSVALDPSVSVREYVALPDDNAYPAALAIAPDGSLITGSYSTGAVWRIAVDGSVTEIPNTRDQIGAASGFAVTPDNRIYVVDQRDTDPRTTGGTVWLIDGDQVIDLNWQPDSTGWIAINDITLDAAQQVYISDSGRGEIWRFAPGSEIAQLWWAAPPPAQNASNQRRAITGIAYDAAFDAIIAADAEQNIIYRIPLASADQQIMYAHGNDANPPGFDGVTVDANGQIYAAALGQNGIARIDAAGGSLTYIAGLFRGASDVEYAAGRLFVTNFDQASIVLPFIAPQLPFAVDVIDLNTPSATTTPAPP
jgi:sugar lactone lactonase YvrE